MARDDKQPTPSGDRIEWFTVRYRTLLVAAFAVLLIGVLVWALLGRRTPPPPPAEEMTETGARFVSIEGSVQVKRAGTLEWIAASRVLVLSQNDLVRTGSGGTAEIHFADGTVFNVRPDSLITVEESSQNPVSRLQRTALSIQSGEANFQTAGRAVAGSTTISTPTVRTTVERDTAGSMQVAESGATSLRVFRGSGQAQTRAGQHIRLASNEGVQVDSGGAAGTKTSLPTVPQLTAPSNQAEITFADLAQGTTILLWSGVPGSSGYRVMVGYSNSFARPLYDRRLERVTQFELPALETGVYYWKVAARDAKGAEGGFSEPWRFTIAKSNATPPPLTVDLVERKGNVLHVRGRTAPGATLTIDGERIEVQPDGSFEEHLLVEGSLGASVRLSSMGAKGGVAQITHGVTVVN